jgi:hypothetical protein
MPNSDNRTRRRRLIVAIATAVHLAVPTLGESGSAGGAEHKIIAESRFDVTNLHGRQSGCSSWRISLPALGPRGTRMAAKRSILLEGEITTSL